MKNYFNIISILIVLITGCEDSNDNSLSEEMPLTKTSVDEIDPIKSIELKKQFILDNKAGNKGKKQFVKTEKVYKVKKTKPKSITRPILDESLTLDNQVNEERILDLKLPFKMEGRNNTKQLSSHQNHRYLPDLFAGKNKPKSYPVRIDGKIIERVEKEADKDSIVDGVGLDFKLTP